MGNQEFCFLKEGASGFTNFIEGMEQPNKKIIYSVPLNIFEGRQKVSIKCRMHDSQYRAFNSQSVKILHNDIFGKYP